MSSPELKRHTFILLLVVLSCAFGWVVWPFFGAVFWGAIFAILCAPIYRRLLVLSGGRRNVAALSTLLLCLVGVILPLTFVVTALVQEGVTLYQRLQSGGLILDAYFSLALNALPLWVTDLLNHSGLGDLSALREKLSNGAIEGSKFIATEVLNVGQNSFEFVVSFCIMLYMLFFLLRDGASLSEKIKQALPLSAEHKRHLMDRLVTVLRATVRGNIAVAVTQGTLGGLIFWALGIQGPLLWGATMALLSLLPAVGAALVWGPAAVYFFFSGDVLSGAILVAFGLLVIGLVDNLLRPMLVGKDTQMPDYVVLISTLGGMTLFGLNGFIIGPVIAAMFIAAWDLFCLSETGREE